MDTYNNPVYRFFGQKDYQNAVLSKANLDPTELSRVNTWLTNDKPIMVIKGNPGVGKTFFMLSLAQYIFKKKLRNHPFPSVFCYREKDIYDLVAASWKAVGTNEDHELRKIIDHEYLFIDDLGAGTSHDWNKSTMFKILDARFYDSKKTFFTTNLDPQEISSMFGDRFEDRINNKSTSWINIISDSLRKN